MSEVLGSKLSDKIRTNGLEIPVFDGIKTQVHKREEIRLRDLINISPVFFIQNVYDYYARYVFNDTSFQADKLPCLAPPYPAFFAEFRFPPNSKPFKYGAQRAGVLFEATQDIPQVNTPFTKDVRDKMRWLVQATSITDIGGIPNAPVLPQAFSRHYFGLGENGAVVPQSTVYHGTLTADLIGFNTLPDYKYSEIVTSLYGNVVFPGMMAITFTHCKGTTITEMSAPKHLDKAHQRKTGQPLLKYHVIDVRPFKDVLKKDGNIDKVGLEQALTTVRGGFADYRKRGLFGKLHGVFWRPDHERGDPANGIIRKDYNSNISQ